MATVRDPRTYGVWLPVDGGFTVGDITISDLSEGHEQLLPHGELWVPHSFTALIDRPGMPRLALQIELRSGRFRCVEIRARARTQDDYVETKDLRRLGVVALVREAAALVSYIAVELESDNDVRFARSALSELAGLDADPIALGEISVGDFFRYPVIAPLLTRDDDVFWATYAPFATEALMAAVPKQRGVVSDQEVASAYRKAYAQNQEVITVVADTFGWARQTAKNRISSARQAGLLPPTVPGRRQG